MADRPVTSHSARPATPRGDFESATDLYPDRDSQYTFTQEFSVEEEEEESEDEDVFAFLAPSSAGPNSATPSSAQLLSQSHVSLPQVPSPATQSHQYPQYFPANVASPMSSPPPFSSFADPLVLPPPTLIPDVSARYNPQAGPSTTSVTTEHRESHSFSVDDDFRLRKLGALPTSMSATTGFPASSSQNPLDVTYRNALHTEKRQASTALSDLSPVDPEHDSASTECVNRLSIPLLPLTSVQDEIRF
jgi:hypothetical protein